MSSIDKVAMNTNLVRFFNGTYNTIWETAIDQEQEQNELDNDIDLSPDNYHSMPDILSKFQSVDIVGSLGIDFIKEIEFTGYHSPKYYNYSTDILEFDMSIDRELLWKCLDKLRDDKAFGEYLNDNFSSYDGFISHTPNSYNRLYDELATNGDEYEQALGALISYLAKDKLESIELDAYYM